MGRNFLILILTLIFTFGMHPLASQSGDVSDDLVPLSAKEADAIIQEEAKAKADEKARRRAFLLDQSEFKVIKQKEISTGQKKLTFNRVEPPLFDPSVTQPEITELIQPPQKQLSEAEMQQIFSEHLQKEQQTLMLSATVYDRKLTRLQWFHEGRQYVAWSNIDFNYLRGLTEIEAKEANYLFFLGIGNESTERLGKRNQLAKKQKLQINRENQIPQLPEFTKGRYEYFVVIQDDTAKRPEDAYIPIDALHDYYESNEERLKIEYQRSKALNEARERYEAEHTEEPEKLIINFWPAKDGLQ